ncbi:uncharacterized protein BDR25DRAFT_222865 [Lindgomyces ingoldianus]|uniref:Uncharacterized protein n=1 Tax=Lindgomyces ingoldianus TaxID=673940 RepID=A0ACB6QXW5_9PLEO|nr:uncharacterized protein BDR25DRAFT_222865 [Lindgomyces ingoldianus]KAF2471662.1 hypothetical protein BDR25DRAFT_222865 [Lindgomyces ingoldianus]
MKSLIFLRLLLAFSPFWASAVLIQHASKSTFNKLLNENKLVFSAFTSKSIESLSSFNTNFELASEDVKTPFVTVDCGEEIELCKEHDVNAYPAVRLFRNHGNETNRYRGRRTSSAIKSYVTKQELPTVTHVQPSSLPSFKTIDDIVILAYLLPGQTSLLKSFRSVAAKNNRDLVFGFTTDMPSADAEGLAMPSIVCYKNTDGDNRVMNGHFTESNIEEFLAMATPTLIGEFSEKHIDKYMVPGKLTVYIFASTERDQTTMRHELTPVAKKLQQYVKFGVADSVEYGPMAKNFGLSEERFPAVVVHAPVNDQVFPYNQARKVTAAHVEAMLMTILEGRATSGQVFGDDAPEIKIEAESSGAKTHDEL